MAAFVIAFAVAVVMVICALGLGFLRGAVQKAEQLFPPSLLLVKPKTLNLAMLKFNTADITAETVRRISGFPGVEFAAPQLSLKMPLRAEGEIMGQVATTDAVMVGIDPVVVKPDVGKGFTFAYDEASSTPVPCIVPRYFLDMYNLAYADSMGLPKINESFALGKEFTLILGETYLLGASGNDGGRQAHVPCRVVGLTDNPSLFTGVLIPLRHATELNRWYRGAQVEKFNAMHVKVNDVQKVDEVTSRILDLGLAVESRKETLEKFLFVARAAGLLTVLFAAAVLAVAAVSIFNTFSLIMNERRGEIGILRAVGGTRRGVTLLFVAEAAAVGLVGGVLGASACWGLLSWGEKRILAALPKVTFLPDQVFLLDWRLAVTCIAGGVLLSVLATLPVILQTTNTAPVRLISESN